MKQNANTKEVRLKSLVVVACGAVLYAVYRMPVALENHQPKPDSGDEIVYLLCVYDWAGSSDQRRNILGLE